MPFDAKKNSNNSLGTPHPFMRYVINTLIAKTWSRVFSDPPAVFYDIGAKFQSSISLWTRCTLALHRNLKNVSRPGPAVAGAPGPRVNPFDALPAPTELAALRAFLAGLDINDPDYQNISVYLRLC